MTDPAPATVWATEQVAVDEGRTLHLERAGEGGPVVVFESGMGVSRSMWGAVAPAVAGHTTTVVYDRAGLGRSPAAEGPRDLHHLVEDHLAVLDHLGDGPFVLVGHSWGGPIVRSAAARRPGAVAGLVLVDQTDEGCDLFFSKANERQVRLSSPLLPVLARLGVLRSVARKTARALPEPHATTMGREDGTVAAVRTQVAEMVGCTDDLRALLDDPPSLPDVPVTVISGTKAAWYERGRRTELVEAHRARAAARPQGRHVAAERSGHLVPFSEPDLVADEVLRIVQRFPAEQDD